MPVLAAPAFLFAALAASVVVVTLHLLAWRRPVPTPLPTARFVPPSAVRTVSRHVRLSDVLLLLVRVLAVVLAGLALARPQVVPAPTGTARVVVLDASRRVARLDEVRDSAFAIGAGVDAVSWVRVDSVARLLPDTALGDRSAARGRLSAGLVVAVREARRLQLTHERVEIVVVSPFAAESWDAATEAIRRAWDGPVRAVRVAVTVDSPSATRGGPDGRSEGGIDRGVQLPSPRDPVGAAFALALDSSVRALRVTRESATAADSAHARGGGIAVVWPSRVGKSSDESATAPAQRTAPDPESAASVETLSDGVRSATGHFSPLPLSQGDESVILRWTDGAAAATEVELGAGCLRTVAVDVRDVGDEPIRPGFVRLVRQLSAPCGGGSAAVVDDARVATWAGPASDGLSTTVGGAKGDAAAVPRRNAPADNDAARWLLVAVALALLLEWWLRGTRPVAPAPAERANVGAREAA